MGKTYTKQVIKELLQRELHTNAQITAEAEVERYTYATKLGTMEHIDYAIPLFGYASQAKKDAYVIYEQLKGSLIGQVPCETEFVNGYMNIMLTNEFLKQALASHKQDGSPQTSDKAYPVTLLRSSSDSEAAAATKLLHSCLQYVGIEAVLTHPFPEHQTASGQYRVASDSDLREVLSGIPGIVQDDDSKAMYLHLGAEPESHALRSVKGGWYAPAFVIASLHEHIGAGKRVFVVGASEINKLMRSMFEAIESLDTDVHAKQLKDASQRSIETLITGSKESFQDQTIQSMPTKRRRELLYVIDFEYEITEAVRLGDLKRIVGELSTLIEQHPLPDVA